MMQFNTVLAFTASREHSSQSYNDLCVRVCVCVFGRECKNFCRYVGVAQTQQHLMKDIEKV
jgi:hypothetical protein